MQFTVKIYDIDGTIQTQIIDPDELSFSRELDGVGEMTFRVAINSQDALEIREWRIVELSQYDESTRSESIIWRGYITIFDYVNESIEVECSQEKKILDKKIITGDINYNGTVANLLDTLTTQINSRSAGIEPPITYSTSLTDTVTQEWTAGTSISDILEDVADLLEAEWDLKNNEIILEETIGIDRTVSGDDYMELISSANSPSQNNIANLKISGNAIQMSTYVLGKNSSTTNIQSDSTTGFGVKETAQSFTDGDLIDQTQSYLDEHKIAQREIKVEPSAIYTDFMKVGIGDKIKLKVERDNPLIDGEFDLKVLKTKVDVRNAMPVLTFDLADKKKKIVNAKNFFADIARRLKLQELK